MQSNHVTVETLKILNEMESKGYIPSQDNALKTYYNKVNFALTRFLQEPSVDSKSALKCMDLFNQINQNTKTFPSSFSPIVMDLYEKAITGEEFIRNQAETKLLIFFSKTSPSTIEHKKRLLNLIEKMPDFSTRRNEIPKVVVKLATHYDQNQQFKDDSADGVLKSLSDVLHRIKIPTRSNGNTNQQKTYLRTCAQIIKKYRPDLCEESWNQTFTSKSKKTSIPEIKEPVSVYTRGNSRSFERIFSKGYGIEN